MHELKNVDDLKKPFAAPLAILFKHSTQCSISEAAYKEMEKFASVHKHAPLHLIQVLEHPAVSDEVAKRTKIEHESPQIIVLESGVPVWHASHYNVTAADLEGVVVEFN